MQSSIVSIIIYISLLHSTFLISFNIDYGLIPEQLDDFPQIPMTNLRNLNINTNLLYKQYYITITICIGIPSKCFKLLYDTTSYHMCVTNYKNSSSPLITTTYHDSPNATINNQTTIATSSRYFDMNGNERNDLCVLKNDSGHHSFFFTFISSMQVNVKYNYTMSRFQFDGVIGFAPGYQNRKKGIFDNEQRFSLVNVLYDTHLIDRKVLSHKLTDNYHRGKLYIGETGFTDTDDYSKCNCVDEFNWNCRLDYIAIGNKTLFNHSLYHNSNYNVVFDSILFGIELPSQLVIKIISDYVAISHNQCVAINYFALKCERGFNLSQLPSITFRMQNVTIDVSPELLFDLDKDQTHEGGVDDNYYYMNKMNITDTPVSRLGLIVLREYHMIFDYDNNSVGFYKEMEYGWSRLTMIMIAIGGMLVMLVLSVLLYQDSLFRLKEKVKRSHSLSLIKNSVELLERSK